MGTWLPWWLRDNELTREMRREGLAGERGVAGQVRRAIERLPEEVEET